jgi:hypothetical protein
VGSRGEAGSPWPAVWVSLLVPAAGWLLARRLGGGRKEREPASHTE